MKARTDAVHQAASTRRTHRQVRGPVGGTFSLKPINFVAAVQDDESITTQLDRNGTIKGRRVA